MSDRRRGLGRGLGALIPNTPSSQARPVDVFFPGGPAPAPPSEPLGEVPPALAGDLVDVPGARFAEIPVEAIVPNPRQPRLVFDDDELDELTWSIKELGVLQPIVVRPRAGQLGEQAAYELVMGERRWRASQAAGLATVPAIIRETDDDALLRDALLENLHRSHQPYRSQRHHEVGQVVPPPPPPPPRKPPPPPPPPRAGRSSASFTRRGRPSSICPSMPSMAFLASSGEPMVTKPKPRGRPVSRSLTR